MLIVDDDDVDREYLRRLLRRADAQVEIVEATDLSSALQHLKEGRVFDCVFLDSRLPDGEGVDLVDRFANTSNVVFLSGSDDQTVNNEALQRGATACFGKGSVTLKILNQTIGLNSRGG
ncbi:response regulator [Parasedimentitalea marina]|nr:response regulator [Parasedimentitalea marina]